MTDRIKIKALVMNCAPRTVSAELLNALSSFDTVVMRDEKKAGPWSTHRRCLEYRDGSYMSHLLIVNDDAIPTPWLNWNVTAVAERRVAVDQPVMLYSYHRDLAAMREKKRNWLETYTMTWGVAWLIPVPVVEDFLAWNDQNVRDDWRTDDTRWSLWACAREVPNLIFAPSLFDHDPDAPSLVNPDARHERSAWVSDGPLERPLLRFHESSSAEQDPEGYLRSRRRWLKPESRWAR